MSLIKIIKPDFEFKDERGCLIQLCRRGYSQINLITSNKGVLRGNHYHKLNTEAFYVISGKFEVTAKQNETIEKYTFTSGDMFLIPPYVIHSFYYNEETCLISMYSLGVEIDIDNDVKDTYLE